MVTVGEKKKSALSDGVPGELYTSHGIPWQELFYSYQFWWSAAKGHLLYEVLDSEIQ